MSPPLSRVSGDRFDRLLGDDLGVGVATNKRQRWVEKAQLGRGAELFGRVLSLRPSVSELELSQTLCDTFLEAQPAMAGVQGVGAQPAGGVGVPRLHRVCLRPPPALRGWGRRSCLCHAQVTSGSHPGGTGGGQMSRRMVITSTVRSTWQGFWELQVP